MRRRRQVARRMEGLGGRGRRLRRSMGAERGSSELPRFTSVGCLISWEKHVEVKGGRYAVSHL